MESKEADQDNTKSISTEDILKSLEKFGNRSKSPEEDRSKGEETLQFVDVFLPVWFVMVCKIIKILTSVLFFDSISITLHSPIH